MCAPVRDCILSFKIPNVEPHLTTDPELGPILAELSSRGSIFYRPEFGTNRADFEKMTGDDFCEVGASGALYSRKFALDELERRHATSHADMWETSEFLCRRLAPDVYLLTYNLLQHETRKTQSSTIWQRSHEGWKIVYHQGIIVRDRWSARHACRCAPATGGHVSPDVTF
ncbi:MAG TPA: DUF4440 domain-containing protein [Candidatus Sulfotelmatobacter sp.]|nr:DUF4440 domain-containing protein [Candidatus Sulfotelmatobacter sp.]